MPAIPPDNPPLLAARGLAFARNEQPVFGPLDFAVDAGEALLVQGDNGAGKTTLLRVLAGLLPADSMAIVGLAGYEDSHVRQLSAGQRERLSLARLWLAPSPLWLLDEP